jgi:hypothetical protein
LKELPHLIDRGPNKKLEDAEQRGAQKLHVIELSEVGTDAS